MNQGKKVEAIEQGFLQQVDKMKYIMRRRRGAHEQGVYQKVENVNEVNEGNKVKALDQGFFQQVEKLKEMNEGKKMVAFG